MLWYYRANGQYRNSTSSLNQWSLQPASKPPASVGWLWLDLCSVEWEPGRKALSKSNSLCSGQAPNQFFPGMKLSTKNNVHSSRNNISGPHLTPDLESRGLSVLSALRWHRGPRVLAYELSVNWERAQAQSYSWYLFYVGGRELVTLPVDFKVHPHKARKSEGKETMFPAHNHRM